MTCPYCNGEMAKGAIKTQSAPGLFFLPSDETVGVWPTHKGIQKKGGTVLAGPYRTVFNLPRVPAFQCAACRKIIIAY